MRAAHYSFVAHERTIDEIYRQFGRSRRQLYVDLIASFIHAIRPAGCSREVQEKIGCEISFNRQQAPSRRETPRAQRSDLGGDARPPEAAAGAGTSPERPPPMRLFREVLRNRHAHAAGVCDPDPDAMKRRVHDVAQMSGTGEEDRMGFRDGLGQRHVLAHRPLADDRR